MTDQKINSVFTINRQVLPFINIHTKTVLEINNAEAGFIWIYLLSMNEDEITTVDHIKKKFNLSDKKIEKIFSYLFKNNLLTERV